MIAGIESMGLLGAAKNRDEEVRILLDTAKSHGITITEELYIKTLKAVYMDISELVSSMTEAFEKVKEKQNENH